MLAHALLLLLVAGGAAQLACNNEGPRNDCGYVGITQQQCNAKSRVSIPARGTYTEQIAAGIPSTRALGASSPTALLTRPTRCVGTARSESDRRQINSVAATANGLTASLGIISQGPSLYGADVNPLQVRPTSDALCICSLSP